MKRMKRNFWASLTGLLFLAILGCATIESKPPIKNPQILESNLPSAQLITGVPWYRQGRKECGPTSIAMVLNFYGRKVTKDEIARCVMSAGKFGTELEQLEYYAEQQQGLKTYRLYDRTKDKSSMKYLIAQGYPLIAIGRIPQNWHSKWAPLWEGHYVVVVGYDDVTKNLIIQDPAWGKKGYEMTKVPYRNFGDFHTHSQFPGLVLCIYPK